MSYAVPADVVAQIDQHLKSGNYATADEVLRDAMQALNQANDDWLAVKEALDAFDAGEEGIPLDVAFKMIRERNP